MILETNHSIGNVDINNRNGMMQDTKYTMKRKVSETIRKYQMINPGDHILVGLSGGQDSVALLDVLTRLRGFLECQVSACHLNHQLRGDESLRDERFVKKICSERKIHLYSERRNVFSYKKNHGISLEEAARIVRYRFFRETAEAVGCNKVATGHHADDNAESVLIYLLRGSGSAGLSGIPPVRDGFIIRPLIEIRRSDIQEYLKGKGLVYVDDSSNHDTAILRNRIRKHLIPDLENKYNPAVVEVLNRLSHVSSCENAFMEDCAAEVYPEIVTEKGALFFLDKKLFKFQKIALKRRLIRLILKKVCGNLRKIGLIHVDMILRLSESGCELKSVDLPNQVRVFNRKKALEFMRVDGNLRDIREDEHSNLKERYFYTLDHLIEKPVTVLIKETGDRFVISQVSGKPAYQIAEADKHVLLIESRNVNFPLTIRSSRRGDVFYPQGFDGRQKINRLFMNHKIDHDKRALWPIVEDQDEIIWVPGLRYGRKAALSSNTDAWLKVELFLAK